MANLNFFGIDNFKVFKDLNRFELKPITVLVGTNSSGKSSLSKGILALKSSFEKITVSSSYFRNVFHINMVETEELFFQPSLHLGNFTNCLNNKSNSSYIAFELPIKFPPLNDSFFMRFVYKKSNNALQNGRLNEIKIIHTDTNNDILYFNCENGKMKIKFSFLKKLLDMEVEKVNEVVDISKEIVGLIMKYRGLDLSNELPEDIEKHINYLKEKQRSIYPNFQLKLDFYKEEGEKNYMLDAEFVGIDKSIVSKYIPKNFPLINFPFLFKQEVLDNIFTNSDDYQFDVEPFKDKNVELNNYFAEIDNPIEYFKRLELECLDELIMDTSFFRNSINSFEIRLTDLLQKNSSSSNNHLLSSQDNYPLMASVIRKIIEKEPILDKPEFYSTLGTITLNIFDVFAPIVKHRKTIIPDNFSYFMKDFIYDGITESLRKLGEVYATTHYIPAVRTKMDRFFRIEEGISYLHEVLYEYHKNSFSGETKQFIESYVKKFAIADSIDITIMDDSSGTKIFLTKDGKKQELADVGYGVAQVLPIILKLGILISGREKENFEYEEDFYENPILVIIEEPETNLHPALQSKLADMFVECQKKYNIKFIIETHSEYFIRKLQYLTAKKKFAAKDSVIYYFNDPNNIPTGEKQVKKIEILEDGSLSDDFGSGFFDEATNWKFELMELRKAQKN